MKIPRLFLAFILALPIAVHADENPRHPPAPRNGSRHYMIRTEHVLREFEKDELAARGIEIQHVLPENRYLVRAADAAEIAADLRVISVVPFAASQKIAPSALHEAASGRAFAHVRLIFHDDVSFDDARAAVEAAGGTLDQTLATDFHSPHRLVARIPSSALQTLAADEGLFAIYGPPLRPAALNSVAAQLSNVTPLYSPPYGLSGQGVDLSEFELAPADTTHPEFQGRLKKEVTFASNDSSDAEHATHVAGTIMAAGINPLAKGMSPAATLHEFDANSPTLIPDDKQNKLPPLNIVADNNSWGFQLGWQFDPSASMPVWFGGLEYFGGYDGFYVAPYDKIARNGPVLFVHSAGNDGSSGRPPFTASSSGHEHADDNGNIIKGETFCYSQDGSGTDCPTPFCSAPLATHCEKVPHPMYGPICWPSPAGSPPSGCMGGTLSTMGVLSSAKNVVAVGAVDSNGGIASFSSRGPTVDGRVKPDVVAMGVGQFSTLPNGGYGNLNGTSMSSPVVTGICGLLTEQWRKTFSGQTPTPEILKMLLIAGADDLGNPGPDYTYGFGLADAKNSADLIIADNNSGSRVRGGDLSQGQQVTIPLSVTSPQKVRVVLGWSDPEVVLGPNDLAGKTLVNDLALQVTGPGGTALPYVLDPNNPNNNATTGVNTTDNVLEVEIPNAQPGSYNVQVTGSAIATGPTQHYVVVSNAPMSNPAPVCGDIYKPNRTAATAFGPLASGTTIGARLCSATDLAFFKVSPNAPGPLTVTVAAADTPLQVTLSGNGIAPVMTNIAAGASGSVSTNATPGTYVIEVAPNGTLGASGSYTLTPVYRFTISPRRRTASS